jgi:hypothetical protein
MSKTQTTHTHENDDEYAIQEKILGCIKVVVEQDGFVERSYNHGKMIAIIREMMAWKNQ